MEPKSGCRQCRKEIKTEIHKYIPCEKVFHPNCVKLHKVCNTRKKLISCKVKVEVYVSANVKRECKGGGRWK